MAVAFKHSAISKLPQNWQLIHFQLCPFYSQIPNLEQKRMDENGVEARLRAKSAPGKGKGLKYLSWLLGLLLLVAIVAIVWLAVRDFSSGDRCAQTNSTTEAPTTTPATTTTTRAPDPGDSTSVQLTLSEDTVLHVWLKAVGREEAVLYARNAEGAMSPVARSRENDEVWYDYSEIELRHEGPLDLVWWPKTTTLSFIYAFEPETVQEQGIRPLFISDAARHTNDNGSFHFSPPLGWINDPNGFSRAQDGLYHLFYQLYPHSLKHLTMSWGHAVSKDLFHWVHQPIFLQPRREHRNGGIFSGSALPASGGGLRIYYTDRIDHIGYPVMENQRCVLTKDMYRPMGPSQLAIAERPVQLQNSTTEDFRDPNVFRGPGGHMYMTLGSKYENGSGIVLLYKQDKSLAHTCGGWEYQAIIHKETRWNTDAVECSGLIPLGNPDYSDTYYALIFAAQNGKDEDGRINRTPIRVGTFDGTSFVTKFEQDLDFAVGSYGFQGFYDPIGDQALLVGWLANWPDTCFGMCDTMAGTTLPRVIKLNSYKSSVRTPPHPNVENLRMAYNTQGVQDLENFKPVPLPDGTQEVQYGIYYYRLYDHGPSFSLVMNHTEHGANAIVVSVWRDKQQGYGLELTLAWMNSTEVRMIEHNAAPDSVRVFIDVGSIEVFADDGRYSATARIPGSGRVESVQFVGNSMILKSGQTQMWSMKSTHPRADLGGPQC